MLSLLSACGGGDPRVQQTATQNLSALNQSIKQAQDIGVPSSLLKSVLKQKQVLSSTNAPLALFNEQPVTDYYQNLATNYGVLKTQMKGIIQVATEQSQQQAQTDLQNLQHSLATKANPEVSLDTLTQVYTQNQASLKDAKTPKDYLTISANVNTAISTLNLLPATVEKLQSLNQIISILQTNKQDIGDLQQQYDADKADVAKATQPKDMEAASQKIDDQSQQVASRFNQLIPQLVQAKVDELSGKVDQIKQAGIDATKYQQQLDADRAQTNSVKTLQDYQAFSKKVDADVLDMHLDLVKAQTIILVQQYHQEVTNWGNAHTYADPYNGITYPLDGPYMTKGLGEDIDRELNAAQTEDDYQQVLTDTQNAIFHLKQFETDASDSTSYDQPHATDKALLDHYQLGGSHVIVVSFIEDALRYYVNGQLIRSFQVTAGRPELPPVPGLWSVLWRQYKTVFKSPYPKGSPYWYEDTPINYAIMYHTGGYFIHDSYWRNDYGPYTQFFHHDSSGNASANNGTHGCVNMRTADVAWLYDNTDYSTQILMY
ncbi:L,D-transpeptidase [Tengunoibacter tsumagoiensis]|nr:L,D-transpeptidase [Tengunoibacter tsumagoiensis]